MSSEKHIKSLDKEVQDLLEKKAEFEKEIIDIKSTLKRMAKARAILVGPVK